MSRNRVVILRTAVSSDAPKDEQDALVEAQTVAAALEQLGYEPLEVAVSLELGTLAEQLKSISPLFVFNIVESIAGHERLHYVAPALLDAVGISYTGSCTEAMFTASHKLTAKRLMHSAGIPTPTQYDVAEEASRGRPETLAAATWILKPAWGSASIGINDEAVLDTPDRVRACFEHFGEELRRGELYLERYVDGREFNLSILEEDGKLTVLPPAEIIFDEYPEGKPRIVGYNAKWNSGSFEFSHTPRRFDFGREDGALLRLLEDLAKRCFSLFGLRGYARVDFRIDSNDNPVVLEVNTNPCMSPDAGFAAAVDRAGRRISDAVEAIVATRNHPSASMPIRDSEVYAQSKSRVRSPRHRSEEAARAYVRFRDSVAPADVEIVRTIAESTGFFTPSEVSVVCELVEERLHRGLSSGYHFLFAEQGDELAGFSCFGPIACTIASFDLYWIVVRSEEQGKGIGRMLIAESERRSRLLGGNRIYVETSSRRQYDSTRSFYERAGYQHEATIRDFYAPGDAKVIYVKELLA